MPNVNFETHKINQDIFIVCANGKYINFIFSNVEMKKNSHALEIEWIILTCMHNQNLKLQYKWPFHCFHKLSLIPLTPSKLQLSHILSMWQNIPHHQILWHMSKNVSKIFYLHVIEYFMNIFLVHKLVITFKHS